MCAHLEEEWSSRELEAHFRVETHADCWIASTTMAAHVERAFDSRPVPEWVAFVDVFGARIRVRTASVVIVAQSTSEQRAANRAFRRMIDREHCGE